MTHMHIPDGILPVWLWVAGFFVMILGLGVSLSQLKDMDIKVKLPLLGALTAAMLVSMSIEIIPPFYHINLSVVTGILLGPSLGFVAAFIANVVLSLIGHGGITVIGLNTILLGSEAVLGHAFFSVLSRRMPIFWRAATATIITLMLTTGLLIGIVALSGSGTGLFFLHEPHEHDPPIKGDLSVFRFAVMALGFGGLGWIIESGITGGVVRFIARVKPEILKHALHKGMEKGDGR